MHLNILIPSKENPLQLKENILKNEFPQIFKKIKYYVLVDSIEEKQQYQNTVSRIGNVDILIKKFEFQSERYAYLLSISEGDYYLIGSDDVYFKVKHSNNNLDIKSNVLSCINEDELIINHPLVSNRIKKNLIDLLYKYNFKTLCIDTLISFYCKKKQRQFINLDAYHLNLNKKISKTMYRSYTQDLFNFFIFAILNSFKFGDLKRNLIFIFFILKDLLSASKNYLLFSIK